jgi:hypothetical protein
MIAAAAACYAFLPLPFARASGAERIQIALLMQTARRAAEACCIPAPNSVSAGLAAATQAAVREMLIFGWSVWSEKQDRVEGEKIVAQPGPDGGAVKVNESTVLWSKENNEQPTFPFLCTSIQ